MVEKEGKLIAVADMKDRSIKIVESLGRINLDNLMDEVAEAGAQTIWWSTLAAMAGKELNTAQLALERLKAEVGRSARVDANRRGDKITERGVEESVLTSLEVQKLQDHIVELQFNLSLLTDVKFAMNRKASTLESLAQLIVQEVNARKGPAKEGGAGSGNRRNPV